MSGATSAHKFPNPLIPGFYPDPSILRVGEDYYLANSTFEYLPGIPVFHSRDLVQWNLIGHVITRYGQLGDELPTNGGAWAPTIRHRDGTFYVVVTDAMGRGMLIFTAADPTGPWSDGTLVDGIHGIDPDLAWDTDGAAYITYSGLDTTSGAAFGGHGGILQITVDLASGKPLSDPESLWSGTGLKFPEAPHLYLHDGWWYLMIAEGGTERGHGISIARGPSPAGPFEGGPGNPVVSARSTNRPIQNTGHGDLVQTPDGGWAVVMLGMRPAGGTQAFAALGRETFITPARWVDGWLEIDPVILAPRPGQEQVADDFDTGELAPEWISVRRFPAELASLQPDGVALTGDGSTLDGLRPVFLARRPQHQQLRVAVRIDPGSGLGGLAVRFDELHHYEIEVGGGVVTVRAAVAGIRQEWTAPAPSEVVTLHLDCEPPTGPNLLDWLTSDIIVLGVSDADSNGRVDLARVDGRYLSQETAASFTGRVIGIYAVRGTVTFSRYRYTGWEA